MKPKIHSKSDEDPDLLVNLKYFPNVEISDILEIYHENNDFSRLLLKVTKNCEDLKDTSPLSIEQSVAAAFQLSKYKDVVVTKVQPRDVKLDLVELLYKDQYYNRSDMWHMRSHLVDTCAYLNMGVQHTEMKANVCEMWAKGEKVMCGYIASETRIVFRSQTAVVQIYIQMSSEMWEFDNYGDLYFEKAVGGFLCDLFDKWKEKKCSHDVTIVLFSRTFFDVPSIDSFPPSIRECLQQDHRRRFYEDYYRIVIQNERYDEWNQTHVRLRELFNGYQDDVLAYHSRHGNDIPRGYNSMASQGNFLETLNMAINMFEKAYLDHCFDRTGQVAVVITPGAGVFEVDRELCNITKQRTIDCGVGSDLVCVGEQPLHAVPLFKFHNKSVSNSFDVGDDYNIPHWMNHSFYTSRSQSKCLKNSTFVPRIKPPKVILDRIRNGECNDKIFCPPREDKLLRNHGNQEDNFEFIDYDEYDAQIFKPPSRAGNKPGFHPQRSKSFFSTSHMPQTMTEAKRLHVPRDRHTSDNFIDTMSAESEPRSTTESVRIPSRMNSRDSSRDSSSGTASVGCYPISEASSSSQTAHTSLCRPIVGSAGSAVGRSKTLVCLHNFRPNRALINPFAPSRMHFKMTSNRRRWVHAFPMNPKGAAVQTHHMHCNTTESDDEKLNTPIAQVTPIHKTSTIRSDNSFVDLTDVTSLTNSLKDVKVDISPSTSYQAHGMADRVTSNTNSLGRKSKLGGSQQTVQLWGATGEQDWSPEIITGHDWRPLADQEAANDESHLFKPILTAPIDSQTFCSTISVDWKSIVIPASLPITTDYFPDSRCLNNDYVQNQYALTDDDFYSDIANDEVTTTKPSQIEQLFHEMISQRISQGFQLVVKPKQPIVNNLSDHPQYEHVSQLRRGRVRDESKNKYYLSIGRIFHVLELTGQSIAVHRFRPRHPQPQLTYDYHYRFQAPDSYTYDVSSTQFSNAKLENYNWNYLDQYLLTRGSDEYGLIESLKYWRSRFLLMPCNSCAIKKILDGQQRCDIFEEKTPEELQELTSGFIRFIEMLNSIKRSHSRRRSNTRKKAKSIDQSSQSTVQSSGDVKKISSTITQMSNEFASVTITGTDTANQQSATAGCEESLPSTAPLMLLVEEMIDANDGIPLLGKQKALPIESFISAEAVEWCLANVADVWDVAQACDIMQKLLNEGLICHASGNHSHPFIYGFYIYSFTHKEAKERIHPSPTFNTDWWEIGIPQVLQNITNTHNSLAPDLTEESSTPSHSYVSASSCSSNKDTGHKYYNLDISKESKHPIDEWASVRYHANFDPRCAFEVTIRWLVATGCILAELVFTWARHVKTRTGFHLLPAPVEPFALPHTENSDPLRGPIFIPLMYDCLLYPGSYLSSTDGDARLEIIMQLQNHILKRFGFMPIQPLEMANLSPDQLNQYIHCTGGMFVLIADMRHDNPRNKQTPYSPPRRVSISQQKYIARKSVKSPREEPRDVKVGFLWSWNHMSSSRWRSQNTGHGEWFQDHMLKDFRLFCGNVEGRLEEVWRGYEGHNFVVVDR